LNDDRRSFIGLDEHLPVMSSSGNIIFDFRVQAGIFNNELIAGSQVFFFFFKKEENKRSLNIRKAFSTVWSSLAEIIKM